jgi:hypothetical protein
VAVAIAFTSWAFIIMNPPNSCVEKSVRLNVLQLAALDQ